MNLSDRSEEYLIKTYCHLIKKVLPQTEKNQIDFPPTEMWVDVIDAIKKAIDAVTRELESRNIYINELDCIK